MRLFGRGSFPDPESRRPARVSSRAVRRSVAAKPGTRDRRPENNKDPRLARVAGPVACLREEKLPSTNALIVVICVCERSMRSPRRSFARYSGRRAESVAPTVIGYRFVRSLLLVRFVRVYYYYIFFIPVFPRNGPPRGLRDVFPGKGSRKVRVASFCLLSSNNYCLLLFLRVSNARAVYSRSFINYCCYMYCEVE